MIRIKIKWRNEWGFNICYKTAWNLIRILVIKFPSTLLKMVIDKDTKFLINNLNFLL